jgi:hypothetical protein
MGPPGDTAAEWLVDAAAFDSAGADLLWIDVLGRPELDPLALAAALAAVTHRAQLVVPEPAEAARSLATVRLLSRGRVKTAGPSGDFRPALTDPAIHETAGGERWASVPVPAGREQWTQSLTEAAGRRLHGLIAPADSRLLDLLRNPEDPGQRHDLQLTVG